MKIAIMGAGNTATVLANRMYQRGHAIKYVWSRRPEQAQALAMQVAAEPLPDVTTIDKECDLCMLCVSDTAIATVANGLQLQQSILVHTAGSVPLAVLEKGARQYGVLYPLQRMRKEQPPVEIPFLIDGNSAAVINALETLALSLSPMVQKADDALRLRLHLAAVISGNFTQHLLALTEDWCAYEGADARLLVPLLQEVIGCMGNGTMAAWQTGPARRGDLPVLEQHLALLNNHPRLAAFYRLFSESIYGMYHKNGELRWHNTAS